MCQSYLTKPTGNTFAPNGRTLNVNDTSLQTQHTVCENCQYWLLHQEHETEYKIRVARDVQKKKILQLVLRRLKKFQLDYMVLVCVSVISY